MMLDLTDEQVSKLTEPYPRGWLIHYWEELCQIAANLSFSQKKSNFFCLIERLLREGKIKFDLPLNDPRQDEFWEDPPEVILAHLREHWPTQAASESDPAIVDYFYDTQRCPPVSWLSEDGQWHSS